MTFGGAKGRSWFAEKDLFTTICLYHSRLERIIPADGSRF